MTPEQRKHYEKAERHLERAKALRPPEETRPVPIREIIHATEPSMIDSEKKTTYCLAEAAELVGRSPETIRRYCAKGDLKAAGGGKGTEWRISRVELAAWWRRQGGGRLFPDTNDEGDAVD